MAVLMTAPAGWKPATTTYAPYGTYEVGRDRTITVEDERDVPHLVSHGYTVVVPASLPEIAPKPAGGDVPDEH